MKLTLIVLTLMFLTCAMRAQEKIPDNVNVSRDVGSACEQNSVEVARFRQEIAANKGFSFVVFRLGEGENYRIQNSRFNNISKFLRVAKGLDKNVIYTKGEPTKGQGRIEFYNEGKLSLVILIKKNDYPCMDCCPGRYKL